MTHPLTDEMCESICQNCDTFTSQNEIWFQSMRAAFDKGADWRLEQVIEWLRSMDEHSYLYTYITDPHVDKDELIADLKEAMRPQQQEDKTIDLNHPWFIGTTSPEAKLHMRPQEES